MNDKTCIGIITPSSAAPSFFVDRYNRGVSCLRSVGFDVIEGKYVTTRNGMTSATAKERAEDINEMFSNANVSLVMATIGGHFSAETLPFINWDAICASKATLIGYSDITVLLNAIGVKAGKVVYYGPTLMTEIAEYPKAPPASINSLLSALDKDDVHVVAHCDTLYSKGTDWALAPTERLQNVPVFSKTIRAGKCEGVVIGGCIESLERLRGTEYFPSFKNAILLLETSEDDFSELKWRNLLTDYSNLGILDEVNGIVIGQKNWTINEVDKLSDMLIEATEGREIPILYGLPFGHITPIATVPLYATAILDSVNQTLEYEKPFKYSYEGK